MSLIRDAVKAMKEVVLLNDRVEQAGDLLNELSHEVRDLDRRLVRIETMVELSTMVKHKKLPKKKK